MMLLREKHVIVLTLHNGSKVDAKQLNWMPRLQEVEDEMVNQNALALTVGEEVHYAEIEKRYVLVKGGN